MMVMAETPPGTITPTPLRDAVDAAFAAPVSLLALGIPLCPSCELLSVSLAEIQRSRPGVRVLLAAMDSQADWDAREEVLWPRDIHVSRASIPVLVLVRDGTVVDSRHGGGPASHIDVWLTEHLGEGDGADSAEISAGEVAALEGLAHRRANLLAARSARRGLD